MYSITYTIIVIISIMITVTINTNITRRGYQSTVEKGTARQGVYKRLVYTCLTIWPYSKNEPNPKTFKERNRT